MLHTQKIQIVYQALKNRDIHPEGEFDKQGRWFPSDDENCGVRSEIRTPSRSYPYSYMTACRTKKHVRRLAEESPELFQAQFQKALKRLEVNA